jgi:hypothetical protein
VHIKRMDTRKTSLEEIGMCVQILITGDSCSISRHGEGGGSVEGDYVAFLWLSVLGF